MTVIYCRSRIQSSSRCQCTKHHKRNRISRNFIYL